MSALRVQRPIGSVPNRDVRDVMIVAWNTFVDHLERDDAGEVVHVDGRPKAIGTWELSGTDLGRLTSLPPSEQIWTARRAAKPGFTQIPT